MKLNRMVTNASWIIACKIARSCIAFFIGILTARYLGPSNYGLINYAASIVAFVAPIMYLGFNSTLVQEFITYPDREGAVLGTAIGSCLISSLICIVGLNAFVSIINVNESTTAIVCLLYSSLLFFQAIDLIQYWFQAKLLAKYTSIAMIIAYVLVSFYKCFLLITHKHIYWFALSSALEYLFVAIILFFSFNKISHIYLSFSKKLAITMLKRSSFFILANLMIVIFTQTDRIMLKLMLGDSATGYYSAAASLALITLFVFGAIIDSVRPVILESKKVSNIKFEENMKLTYCLIIYLSLLQGIGFTLFAKPIVLLSYGSQFSETILTLQIVIWYSLFSYIGAVRDMWILANNYQKYLWSINMAGAIVNVLLNYILIPKWNMAGAAIASVITQFFTNVLVGYIIPQFRVNNKFLISGLDPRGLMQMLKRIG